MARRSTQSILKEIDPEYSLEGLLLKLKLQYFGLLMQKASSLEKTLMLGKIEGKRRKGQQRMAWVDSITTQWTCTWANFGRWCGTGRPGVQQSMGLPGVGHDWATEQQQQGPVIQSVVWTSSSDITWVCWPQMSNLRSHPRPYYKIVLTRCSSDLLHVKV